MENNTNFVNETDYKSLWEYTNRKCNEAEALASDRLDQIEDLEQELAELRRELQDAEHDKVAMGDHINRLTGEVSGLKYAIRYYMAGDAK